MNRTFRFSITALLIAVGAFALLNFWPDGQTSRSPVTPPIATVSSPVSSSPLATSAHSSPANDVSPDVLSILKIESPVAQNQALAALVNRWVARDPVAAVEQVRHMDSGELQTRLLRLVLQTWATKDFPSALLWTAQLTDRTERDTARSCICMTLASRSPSGAVKAAAALPPDEEPPGLLPNLVAQWMDRDPLPAFEWIKQQPSGNFRDSLIAHASFVWSKTNPDEAADLVVNDMSPGPAQDEAAISVLHQWALQDPEGAQKWVARFPGDLRSRAQQELNGVNQP